MARIAAIGETIRIIKQETIKETKALLVKTAKQEHAKVMADAPVPSSFVRIVDGRVGAPEDSVKPEGIIVYTYRRIDEVADFALATLREISPVLSGDYRNAHKLFLNGKEVANLAEFREGDDLMITNYLPYARKIEVGKMKMRVAGSSRVYQQARQIVMSRFGNTVTVEFNYRAIIGGHAVDQSKASTRKRAATGDFEKTLKKGVHNESDLRYPCLLIRER